MLNDIGLTEEVDGTRLMDSLEYAMHGLKWPYEKKGTDPRLPGIIKFEFGLGGFFGYNAWIEPNIDPSKRYDKITVCTQELSPDEKYKNNVQRLTLEISKTICGFDEGKQAKPLP